MFSLPTIPYLTPIVGAAGLLVGLYGGYKLTADHYDAKQAKVDKAVIEQLAQQASIDRGTINDLNTNVKILQDYSIKLGEKRRETKVSVTPCMLTDSGRVLWNEFLLDKEVLSDSAVGTNASGAASTTGTVSLEEAFDNKLENDKRAAINRAKIHQLKEWCVKTFGEARCSGKDK